MSLDLDFDLGPEPDVSDLTLKERARWRLEVWADFWWMVLYDRPYVEAIQARHDGRRPRCRCWWCRRSTTTLRYKLRYWYWAVRDR